VFHHSNKKIFLLDERFRLLKSEVASTEDITPLSKIPLTELRNVEEIHRYYYIYRGIPTLREALTVHRNFHKAVIAILNDDKDRLLGIINIMSKALIGINLPMLSLLSLSATSKRRLMEERSKGPFRSLEDVYERTGIPVELLTMEIGNRITDELYNKYKYFPRNIKNFMVKCPICGKRFKHELPEILLSRLSQHAIEEHQTPLDLLDLRVKPMDPYVALVALILERRNAMIIKKGK